MSGKEKRAIEKRRRLRPSVQELGPALRSGASVKRAGAAENELGRTMASGCDLGSSGVLWETSTFGKLI